MPTRYKKTPSRWRRATIVGLASASLAIVALLNTVARAAWHDAPAVALAVWPGDGPALARAADQQVMASGQLADFAVVGKSANDALRAEPLNIVAMRLSAAAAEAGNDQKTALSRMTLAERLSRRDLLTQLWLSEYSVQNADVDGALRHYDNSLKTVPDSQTILFPVLGAAISEPQIRQKLLPYFAKPAPWLGAFLDYAAQRGASPRGLASLLVQARRTGWVRDQNVTAALLDRLIETGDANAAMFYLRALTPQANELVRRFSISPATTDVSFVPLTWQPMTQAAGFAGFDSERKSARFSLDPGPSRLILRRFLFLPAGHYVLRQTTHVTSSSVSAKAFWSLKCLTGGSFFETWRSPDFTFDTPTIGAKLEIPAGCSVQYFMLSTSGGEGPDFLEFDVSSLSLDKTS